MASGRRSAGERVLESKHVIGLFLLMLLFSGVFFSLGYVMGRNQYDGQVRAANSFAGRIENVVAPKKEPAPKKSAQAPPESNDSDPATPNSSPDWEFYKNNKPPSSDPHLEPVAKPADAPAPSKTISTRTPVQTVTTPAKNSKPAVAPPTVPSGAYVLQVAALQKQDDALAVAGTLQKKHYLCYVQPPQKDKYYRVQVGPFKDRKAADAAKQGLENEGFKAFYVKH